MIIVVSKINYGNIDEQPQEKKTSNYCQHSSFSVSKTKTKKMKCKHQVAIHAHRLPTMSAFMCASVFLFFSMAIAMATASGILGEDGVEVDIAKCSKTQTTAASTPPFRVVRASRGPQDSMSSDELSFLDQIAAENRARRCPFPVATSPVTSMIMSSVNAAAPSRTLNVSFDTALLPVFQAHYKRRQIYSVPDHPECIYAVPDEVSLSPVSESQQKSGSRLTQDYSYSLTQHMESCHFDVSVPLGAFSAEFKYNKEMESVHEHTEKHGELTAYSWFWTAYYASTLRPAYAMELHPNFQADLDALPRKVQSPRDRMRLSEFVGSYNTHYAPHMVFGGSYHLDTFASQDFVRDYTFDRTVEQISLSFTYEKAKLSMDWDSNSTDIHIDEHFANQTAGESYFLGGDPAKMGTKDWFPSIPLQPAPVQVRLRPITELVDDDELRATLEAFIAEYLASGTAAWPAVEVL